MARQQHEETSCNLKEPAFPLEEEEEEKEDNCVVKAGGACSNEEVERRFYDPMKTDNKTLPNNGELRGTDKHEQLINKCENI